MEEAPENGKESSHSTHANGNNEWMNEWTSECKYYGIPYYMIALHIPKFSARCWDDGRKDRNVSPLQKGKTKYIIVLEGNW
jgi:hypothetical protein